ncbi:MAG: SBBP repeat-containing protein, partial [Bacteroidetes bacterium]|nr:SBBP repeat-containing protein [Bacteroidota bacterium]
MKKTHQTRGWFTVARLSFVILFMLFGTASTNSQDFDKQQALNNYGNLSLSFEANVGQTDPRVKFISRGSGYTMFLTSDEVVMVLSKPVKTDALPMMSLEPNKAIETMMDMNVPETETTVLRMKLLGSNTVPAVTGLKELPGITNYFIGNDPQKWYTNVPSYTKVEYREVYEGVDLVYYGNQRQLEFDFVIAPGADPNVIKLDFEGADRLEIDESGDLVIYVEGGELRQHKPVIYQEIDGNRKAVSGGYVLQGERQVSFEIADYDPGRSLVIDPILSYSTYLGGSSNDAGLGIAVDGSGNAYVTGLTQSSDFPTA